MHPFRAARPPSGAGWPRWPADAPPRVSGVSRGIGVEVVGVDLELHRSDGPERFGLDDRHVVRGRDRRAADVAAGRPADVGHACPDPAQDGLHQPLLLHLSGQREGVAAARADRFGPADERCGIPGPVHRADADAQLGETRLHPAFVFGVGEGDRGVGHEDDFAHALQEASDFGQRITQVFLPGVGRIGDEK